MMEVSFVPKFYVTSVEAKNLKRGRQRKRLRLCFRRYGPVTCLSSKRVVEIPNTEITVCQNLSVVRKRLVVSI